MTQEIITTCDRCEAKFDGDPPMTFNFWMEYQSEKFDLCPECMLKLIEWIKAGVS